MPSSHRFPGAIVSLDLQGYSRLTEQDERGTHRALMNCLHTQLSPTVRDRQGAVVKFTGDGALIRFPTAQPAVEAMIHFQEQIAVSEAAFPASRRLVFRIGIHLAPTIDEAGDIYGHGVNLAVRLQECAKPGSIFLSEAVAHRLDPELGLSLARLGSRALKNIEEGVEVYCWPGGAGKTTFGRRHAAGLMAAFLLAAIVFPTDAIDEIDPAFTGIETLASVQTPREARASEKSGKKLIAGTLPTIMPPSGETAGHTALATVEESWVTPYRPLLDGPYDHGVKTTMAAAERSLENRGEIAEDAYLQALALYMRHTPEAFALAIGELEETLVLKSDHGSAHAMLAAIYWGGLQNRWQLGPGLSRAEMLNRAKAHLSTSDQLDPFVHMVRSEMLTASGLHDQAIDEAENAIKLNPSRAVSHYAKGRALLFAGRAREAEAPIRLAIGINPHASRYLFGLALAQFNMGSFDGAERTLVRAIARNGEDDWLYLLMAATQGHLGLKAEARQALGRFDRLSLPRRGWFASQIPFVHRWPFRDRSDQSRLHLGMVLAGLPETER